MRRHRWRGVYAGLLFFFLAAEARPQDRSVRLSGKVVMEDGSALGDLVPIQLDCDGSKQPQGYTKPDGTFSFRLGGEQSQTVPDAGRVRPGVQGGVILRGSSRGVVDLSACSVEAYLPGFSSTSVSLARRSVFENPNIGTIVLRRRTKTGEPTVSATSLYAPPEARKALAEAEKHLVRGRRDPEKASVELEKAVRVYPRFAAAWHRLGEVRAMKQDPEGAREAFSLAAEADPKYVLPCLALALIELGRQNIREAAEYARRVLVSAPALPEAHFYNAVANFSLGNLDRAEASVRVVQGSREAGRYPRTHFLLGNILAQRGAIPEAAAEFRRYVDLEPSSRAAGEARKQLALWQSGGVLE